MKLPRLFSEKEEVTCKCKDSDTLILCTCHFKPMKFKREDVERAIKNGSALCDVCRHIDLLWATEMGKLLDNYKKDIENLDELILKHLDDETQKLPEFPDLLVVVAKAMKLTIIDFNKNPEKYQSICEKKLRIAKEEAVFGAQMN